jgi:hypothetical protein
MTRPTSPRLPIPRYISEESRAVTPKEWRHARLVKLTPKTYQIVSFIAYTAFGPNELTGIGIDPVPTAGLSKKAALTVGSKIESAILRQQERRKGSKKGKK